MWKPLPILCAACVSVFAADFSGIWTGQLPDRNGDVHDLSFRLVQKGDSLVGKMYGDNESTPISGGKISGDEVTFSAKSELNGQHTTFIFSGTLSGGEMRLTRERVDLKDPTAKKDPVKKPEPNPVFTLKRLTGQ